MTYKEKVLGILRELKTNAKTESALINRDSHMVLSDFSYGFHANEVFGAMSSVMLGAAKNITSECRKGPPKKIIIHTGNAYIIIMNAGSNALLMCLTDANNDIDMILWEIEKAAEKLKTLT
ncbi:MAG: roadblock/LC7 domain-containing protein [Thermoplasmata archaeon]|nr:MAG: roadblock/LC7 domain-containing protein [Thermoplasmata archaeon]